MPNLHTTCVRAHQSFNRNISSFARLLCRQVLGQRLWIAATTKITMKATAAAARAEHVGVRHFSLDHHLAQCRYGAFQLSPQCCLSRLAAAAAMLTSFHKREKYVSVVYVFLLLLSVHSYFFFLISFSSLGWWLSSAQLGDGNLKHFY